MDCASVSDLDSMDRDALVAIYMAQQQKLTSLISAQDEELIRLEAELESHRQTLSEQRQALSEQSDELQSRSERIEHLKLMVEKLKHVIFGAKSEKILIQLGQLELQLEDDETTHAEVEASVERVAPLREPKSRVDRKPLLHHLPREVVTYTPEGDCCSACGGELRHFGDGLRTA